MQKNYINRIKERRGHLIGMTIGSGMFYRYAEINDFDFVLITTASRFRHMGANSLAASMPYSNANDMAYDFAIREIMSLSQTTKLPVFFGYCATDPTIDMDLFFDKLKLSGFAGICNIPTVLIMDGDFRFALERAGFSYQKEVDAIRLAHSKGLLTIAMAQDASQAKAMVHAGCDILCMHFGSSKGGVFGAKKELTLERATVLANETFSGAISARNDVILMFYGGPSKTPTSIRFLMEHTKADGFIGGYSIERIMCEENMIGISVQDIFLTKGSDMPKQKKINLVEAVKDYIEKNYSSDINIQTIADLLHVSRSYVSHKFHKEVGMSYQEYLVKYRMEKATDMLLASTMPINEISSAVGYNDVAHFSKMFKKRRGISPSLFRNRAQKDKI